MSYLKRWNLRDNKRSNFHYMEFTLERDRERKLTAAMTASRFTLPTCFWRPLLNLSRVTLTRQSKVMSRVKRDLPLSSTVPDVLGVLVGAMIGRRAPYKYPGIGPLALKQLEIILVTVQAVILLRRQREAT